MDYLAIIARIEARLKQIKMGKMEFYQEMGISPNSFSLWKKGETKPTNENLEKAAEILRCSLEELMFGEKEKAPTDNGGGDDLEMYLDMLRQRPEMRLLLDTVKGATKQEVEENVRFLDALRKSRNAD